MRAVLDRRGPLEHMNFKEELARLGRAGFSMREISRLYQFRRTHGQDELDQAPAVLARLRFIRWLVAHGKLTEHLV